MQSSPSVPFLFAAVIFFARGSAFAEIPRCVPGSQVECACISGVRSVQACKPDGTFASCQCAPSDPTTPVASETDVGDLRGLSLGFGGGFFAWLGDHATGGPHAELLLNWTTTGGTDLRAGIQAGYAPGWGFLAVPLSARFPVADSMSLGLGLAAGGLRDYDRIKNTFMLRPHLPIAFRFGERRQVALEASFGAAFGFNRGVRELESVTFDLGLGVSYLFR